MLMVRGPRVLVETEDQTRTEHASGLITIESEAPSAVGRIVHAGDVRDVSVGDVVLFLPSAGTVLDYHDTRYLVLHEDELDAVLE